MTRDELIEDAKIGDILKLYTESNEVFMGKILDFGSSGLKIYLLENKKSKRITYKRILEYEVEEDIDSLKKQIDLDDANYENITENETVDANSTVRIKIDRATLFSKNNRILDFKEIKDGYIKRLDKNRKELYSRVNNILEYAKKIHEYDEKSDRVERAIVEYKLLAKEDIFFNVFIGVLYLEFGNYKKAKNYFIKSKEFVVAFYIAKELKDNDIFEIAIMAVFYQKDNEDIIEWLCKKAVADNDVTIIKYLVNTCQLYKDKICMYWFAGKNELEMIPKKDVFLCDENIDFLYNCIVASSEEVSVITDIIDRLDKKESSIGINTIDTKDEIRVGIISFYNKNGGNGMIKESEGGQIYFYIEQVLDVELQKILAMKTNVRRKVSYKRGLNFRNEIAADEIVRIIDDNSNTEEPEYAYEGFFEDYDPLDEFGKIRSGKKTYTFSYKDIIDPLLLAEMNSGFSVQELDVKFNIKEYINPKTEKKSKVACEIVSKKKYSDKEIEQFIQERLVSKKTVDEWLSIHDEKKNIPFREAIYKPLKPIEELKYASKNQKLNIGNESTAIKRDIQEEEAISLIVPKNTNNPFAVLTKRNSGEKFFQDAHRYMIGRKNSDGETVGIDLLKAEELFIKAIQSSDQTTSAVANLANIYVKLGDEYIVKGLQLLNEYDYLIPTEKLVNLRIQLIDKSGNLRALELILLSAIPKCKKRNTVRQYMTKLAGIYYKTEQWEKALEWFKKSINYLDSHKRDFVQYEKLRISNLRPLIVSSYNLGNIPEAKKQALEYLKEVPADPIIKSIVDGTFNNQKNADVLDDFDEMNLQYEDEYFNIINDDISKYLSKKLQDVNLNSTFNKVNEVYSKTQNGVFIGSSNDVKKVVEYIQSNILRKNKTALSAEYRSTIYIGIAKIISDSRNNSSNPNENKFAMEEVKRFVARYARYTADAFVEKYAINDSIRFLYIQALKYLVNGDSGNITAATNMLIATFFVTSEKLPDELHEMKAHQYNYTYYKEECISIKDLLIATFMLQEKQQYVNDILEKVYNECSLREDAIEKLLHMCDEEKSISNRYEFDALWKKAKRVYYDILGEIGKEVSDSVNEYHMREGIRQHIEKIRDLMNKKLLWNQDEAVLRTYLDIISNVENTYEKYTVEEKIEGFKNVESAIEKLKTEIESSPTELGYDYVYIKLDDLKFSIKEKLNELYLSSQPECKISLSNDSVYVKQNSVEIAISFRNAGDKQDADAVVIDLKGSDGAHFIKCEKGFSSIRSGEEQEYLAVFSLDENVLSDKQFDVSVNIKYTYRDAVDSTKTYEINKVLPVNITSKENFVFIENKYERIYRGSGVDVNTPELFKGRNDLINSICDSMSSKNGIMTKNRGIILWGQRRVGKNSVKDYLKEKIRKEYTNAYIIIELGSIGKCRNLKEVLTTIINKTEDSLMNEYPNLYELLIDNGMEFDGYDVEKAENFMPKFSRFMDRFSAKLKKIGTSEENIPLYFLDEFSYLYEWIEKGEMDGREFMRFWKSFIQDYGICSIIIAQDNIPVWKSRYKNEFACMNCNNEITYLDFKGTRELICEPCQVDNNILFTQDAVKLIYDWTKGSAYLIVIFCRDIIDYLNSNYTERATKTIVQLVFEKEFIDKKGMFLAEDFEPQIQDVANVGDEGTKINSLNEKLLKEIAKETITSSQVRIGELTFFEKEDKDIAQKVFERLKERKIIEVEKETYCSINMPLLKFFLLREQSCLSKEVFNKLIR